MARPGDQSRKERRPPPATEADKRWYGGRQARAEASVFEGVEVRQAEDQALLRKVGPAALGSHTYERAKPPEQSSSNHFVAPLVIPEKVATLGAGCAKIETPYPASHGSHATLDHKMQAPVGTTKRSPKRCRKIGPPPPDTEADKRWYGRCRSKADSSVFEGVRVRRAEDQTLLKKVGAATLGAQTYERAKISYKSHNDHFMASIKIPETVATLGAGCAKIETPHPASLGNHQTLDYKMQAPVGPTKKPTRHHQASEMVNDVSPPIAMGISSATFVRHATASSHNFTSRNTRASLHDLNPRADVGMVAGRSKLSRILMGAGDVSADKSKERARGDMHAPVGLGPIKRPPRELQASEMVYDVSPPIAMGISSATLARHAATSSHNPMPRNTLASLYDPNLRADVGMVASRSKLSRISMGEGGVSADNCKERARDDQGRFSRPSEGDRKANGYARDYRQRDDGGSANRGTGSYIIPGQSHHKERDNNHIGSRVGAEVAPGRGFSTEELRMKAKALDSCNRGRKRPAEEVALRRDNRDHKAFGRGVNTKPH